MVLSELSIKRPVLASVISLLLVVLGIAALLRMPVREYPAIDSPVVSIATVYKGASSQVIESQITEVIERSVSGIEGVKRITSQSRDERSSVSVEFQINRDVDKAAADVRDKVSRVLGILPEGVDAPVIAKVDADARAIMWIGVTSKTLSQLELTDFLRRTVVDRLAVVPGVSNVMIGGERRYAMRVWLDRQGMAARGITALDVQNAIKQQNSEYPAGRLTTQNKELVIKTNTRLNTPQAFADLVLTNVNGQIVRLGDVAKVEVGPEDDRFDIYFNGETGIGLGIVRQSTANTMSVADGVRDTLEELKSSFPEGTVTQVLYDESAFVRASIQAVGTTMVEGLFLVVLVILVFLRSWRSTIIAAVAIPVSIVAAFIVCAALGFSINVLTLLALVLAVGVVVDDAIVVVENIYRHIEMGKPTLKAAWDGSREIGFAVLVTTLSLMSVFLPLSYLEGRTGRLFSEFGITFAAAIGFSGIVALTLSPMLSSKLLRHEKSALQEKTEPYFVAMTDKYKAWLLKCVAHPTLMMFVAGLTFVVGVGLFMLLPKEFAPTEDRGVIIAPLTAPEGSSLAYTREQVKAVEKFVLPYRNNDGPVNAVLSIVAPGLQRPSPVNSGLLIIRLKPWGEREMKQQTLTARLIGPIASLPGARAFAINPPSLGQSGFRQPIEMVIGGPDYESLQDWTRRIVERAQATGLFANLDTNYKENQPDLRVNVDRNRAADLGVPPETIGRTLELMFGSKEVTTYLDRGREYSVIVQARDEDRISPQDLLNTFVRTGKGQLVPISSFVTLKEQAGPQQLNRVDRLRSISVQGLNRPDVSLGEAIATLEVIAKEELPPEASISYDGLSQEYKEGSSSMFVTFGLALLVVFLVLAAQFESWISPFVIMFTVPLSIAGGLLGLLVFGQSLNTYSQIGMVLLVGIMTKNGILIVEFANQLREQGMSLFDAVVEASTVRLRPILMTAIATVAGAVPLVLAFGAGSEARVAIGSVIVVGVTFSTLMTGFVVPAAMMLIGKYAKPANAVEKALEDFHS